MKRDEYRDLFSDYREGTLEPGLRRAFEARMASDAELKADYAAFSAAWDGLAEIAAEPIELPPFLSARILDRMDVAARDRAARPSWFGLRSLGYIGLAAAAIVGGVWSLNRPSGGVGEAGVLSGTGGSHTLTVQNSASGALIELKEPRPGDAVISSAPDGTVLQRYHLSNHPLRAELVNPNSGAASFLVNIDGEPTTHVTLPGSEAKPGFPATGGGDLLGFTKALARAYRVIVVLKGPDPKTAISWNLTGRSATADASATLAALGYGIDVRTNGLLIITGR